MRLGNLAAAVVRPQLGAVLRDRCARWNERYAWLAQALQDTPHLRLPHRPTQEQFVASSLQFSLVGLAHGQVSAVIAACAAEGVHIKWFGAADPVGFTSAWTHWRYFGEPQPLNNAPRVLAGLCDIRLPLMLSQADCAHIAQVIRRAIGSLSSIHY
jgi:dTDP-4-amino-4,6-dideoxygalactose transaminase